MTRNLADRFLHVCYNCAIEELDTTVSRFETALDLTCRMRSPTATSDGTLLGFTSPIESSAAFLYDARGPRSSPALEVQGWSRPTVIGAPPSEPEMVGIHALGFVVDDVDERCDALLRLGCTRIGDLKPNDNLVVQRLRDPQGVGIDLVGRGLSSRERTCGLSHVRIVCSDLTISLKWYQRFGFAVVAQSTGFDGDPASACLRLAANDMDLWLVQSTGSLARTSMAAPANRLGLFRFATRVESVTEAAAELASCGILVVAGPTTVALAGTSLPALTIAIVRDPDGVLYELVERPATAFR